jgi:DNA-binding LacI/PurR family transcriptional regulator
MSLNLEALSREAGVSIATVSRALSGKPGVSEKRRIEIRELAEKSGYRPDLQARALRSKTRAGWMLLTPSSPTQIVQRRNEALLGTLRKMTFSTQLITTTWDDSPDVILDRIWNRPPAVLLVHGYNRDMIRILEERGRDPRTAVVILDGASPVFDSVDLDRAEGTRLATRMILTGGAKHPVFFTAQSEPSATDARNRGILQAFDELGISPEDHHFVKVSGAGSETGRVLTLKLLEERYIDAIFTYSDQVAYGVLRALYEKGIQIPEEIKVVGFDDLPHSAMTTPSLTTISQPVQEMVDEAIRLAQQRQAHPETDPEHVVLPTRLVPRESCPLMSQAHREQTFLTNP